MEYRAPQPTPRPSPGPGDGRRGGDGSRPGGSPLSDGGVVARVVGQLATLLLLALGALTATGVAAQPRLYFTLGDGRERVREVQGAPDLVERLPSLSHESWSYDGSVVTFDPASGRVTGWVDAARRLKVRLVASGPGAAARPRDPRGAASREARDPLDGAHRTSLRLGASRDEVVRRHGTPWAYTHEASPHLAYLAFGRSVVRLDERDDRVTGWIVRDSSVRVDARDLAAGERAMGVERPLAMRETAAPATLHGVVRWRDDDGDGVVAAGEGATVTIELRNDGPGEARDVRASLEVESPARGTVVRDHPGPATIAPGRTQARTFRLVADSALDASELVAVVRAEEANGFDLSPALRVRIPARAAGMPRLIVRDTRLDDASRDGRLAPREVGDLTISLANRGTAATPPIRGRVWRGRDLFLAAGARDSFALGALPPGGEATITLAVYTNARAADVSLSLELADAAGRVLARFPIALPLTGRPSGVLDVIASRDSVDSASTRRAGPDRTSLADVESALPRPAASRRADAIAVVLGVERYRSLPDARYAERDARLMRRYAVEALGIPDDIEHLYVRTGSDVTGGEMRKLFGEGGWLARRTTENTDLVVYFAGHGGPDASQRAPYLLPFDADPAFVTETGFPLAALYDRLARLPARSITVILDACFSGLGRDGQSLVAGTRPTVLSVEHPALVRRQMGVLTAARGAQSAGDLPDVQHGLLTYWVARGLRGDADANDDGAISFAELGQYAERRVRETAARQDRDQRPLAIARDSTLVVARLAPRR